jgi:hypothetical protein
MGRECNCRCDFAGTTLEVKALLETHEIILRGGIKKRIPFSAIKQIGAKGEALRFKVDGEAVSLLLGAQLAEKWAKAIQNPPTLAKKLGISQGTAVRVVGELLDEALEEALHDSDQVKTGGDLLVACVETPQSLDKALKIALKGTAPLWIVYRKGPGHALNETSVRTTGLAAGLVDTKVAAVSALFTAMRFNPRRS